MRELRKYQVEAIDALYRYFSEKNGNPLIVLPTGTGKSLVIASFIKKAIVEYPKTRILMLTHQRELIEQNAKELRNEWNDAPLGIYSAGLGLRSVHQITFAGIHSIYKKLDRLGIIDIIIIDEAHTISRNANTMYGKLINNLRNKNHHLKLIGFTATPYRLDSGYLHKGKGAIFNDIAYEYSVATAVDEGFLCEPVPKKMATYLDVSNVEMRAIS